jgi:hypothetical protein
MAFDILKSGNNPHMITALKRALHEGLAGEGYQVNEFLKNVKLNPSIVTITRQLDTQDTLAQGVAGGRALGDTDGVSNLPPAVWTDFMRSMIKGKSEACSCCLTSRHSFFQCPLFNQLVVSGAASGHLGI